MEMKHRPIKKKRKKIRFGIDFSSRAFEIENIKSSKTNIQ